MARSPSESSETSTEVVYTEKEKEELEKEKRVLDWAWHSLQANPLLYFRPLPRDPIPPLQLHAGDRASDKTYKANDIYARSSTSSSSSSSSVSPIATFSSATRSITNHDGNEAHTKSSENRVAGLTNISAVTQPERIPLFPICSKRCLKCERILVKPTCETTPTTGADASASSAAPVSYVTPGDPHALPDFKRRHTALCFAPIIEAKSADGFEDYKPSLRLDEFNMVSITVYNPSSLPAVHISISSEQPPADQQEAGANTETPSQLSIDDDAAADSDRSGSLKQKENDTLQVQQDNLDGVKREDGVRSAGISRTASPAPNSSLEAKNAAVPKAEGDICQVDCNGCETWILEDEPIVLDEEGEEVVPDTSFLSLPGVPALLDLLEADTDNAAITGRKSRQVTLVVLVMPDGQAYKSMLAKRNAASAAAAADSSSSSSPPPAMPPITCNMSVKISWPAPTQTKPEHRNELITPLRLNMSALFEPPSVD